ncbi:helix-turn-helix domain-containing protein [Parapedobacter sp.]
MRTLDVKTKIDPHQHLKIAAFRKNIRTTTPHKHNSYMEFVFLTDGRGTHTIDGETHRVAPPVIFTIRKEQVHHWELTGEPEGYVLILKKQYVENSRDMALRDLLTQVSTHTCVPIDATNNLTKLFELLLESWNRHHPYQADEIDGLLKTLLSSILRYAQPKKQPIQTNKDLYYRYVEILRHTESLRNNVAHYAAVLATSPQHLNAVCRKTTGQSAATVLANHLVSEAKRLLHYTELTVKEIAARFDFADSSHFIKYFKRHVGLPPQAFRKQA